MVLKMQKTLQIFCHESFFWIFYTLPVLYLNIIGINCSKEESPAYDRMLCNLMLFTKKKIIIWFKHLLFKELESKMCYAKNFLVFTFDCFGELEILKTCVYIIRFIYFILYTSIFFIQKKYFLIFKVFKSSIQIFQTSHSRL